MQQQITYLRKICSEFNVKSMMEHSIDLRKNNLGNSSKVTLEKNPTRDSDL